MKRSVFACTLATAPFVVYTGAGVALSEKKAVSFFGNVFYLPFGFTVQDYALTPPFGLFHIPYSGGLIEYTLHLHLFTFQMIFGVGVTYTVQANNRLLVALLHMVYSEVF